MTPPVIKFNSKINIPSVNQNNGSLEMGKFSLFKNWDPLTTLEKILIAVKNEMVANKSAKQPAEGDMYWATRYWEHA